MNYSNVHSTSDQSKLSFDTSSFVPLTEEEKRELSHEESVVPQIRFKYVRRALHNREVLIGSLLLLLFVTISIFGPSFSPYTYEETHLSQKNQAPSFEHILGTDDLGRDLATRLCFGLRISLLIGLLSAIIDLCLGMTWGLVSGFIGGTCDQIMMRIAELVYCLPYLLFVILITVIVGPGFFPIIGAMLCVCWIQMARIVRAQVLQIKQSEYITAAYALGIHPARILFKHILPNIFGSIFTVMMLTVPYAIFTEAFLSFLGIGIQPPLASLGSMVSDALSAMRYYPWRLFFPAFAISLCIFACNLLGDGLRDIFDPHAPRSLRS